MPRLRRRGGFTLVEVLVAMMIMAILAVMAWQGVDGIVRARTASQARLEQTLRLNTVLAQWEQDLAAVQQTIFLPGSGLSFDGATLRLVRHADSGLQLVAWSLQPAADAGAGGGTWLRWAAPPVASQAQLQDTWLRSLQLQGNAAGQLRALSGVARWQVYCFHGNAWSNCQSSANLAPPAPGASAPPHQALPSGVRLVLEFADGSGFSGSVTRDVMLAPQWP